MRPRRALVLFGSILGIIYGFVGGQALAATPGFTITASNATMPSSGNGSIAWTLTSVDGFAGSVEVGCVPTNPPPSAIVPNCSYGGPAPSPYTLTANGTVTGTVPLIASTPPCSGPCPVKLLRPGRGRHGGGITLALASALLLGFCFRSRAPRWLMLMLITVGGLAGIGGCGGGGTTLTPGTYAYSITASQIGTVTSPSLTTSATVNVTVPAGIPTNLGPSGP